MRYLFFLLIGMIGAPVFAEAPEAALQKKLDAIVTMQAHFNQVVKASNRVTSKSSGVMALEKPERFRWQIDLPMPQLIVADSQRLWVYDVELEQVTVKAQPQRLEGSPAFFLSGARGVIQKKYAVTEKIQGGALHFDLQAKSEKANFQQVGFTFEGNTLKEIRFFDQLGQQTRVTFQQVKLNTPLSSDLFRFKPPKGVDIVEQ